jgi:hypothetical protein
MLRYAPRFHRKKIGKNFTKKNLTKKNFTKKISQIFFSEIRGFFFQFFLAILVSQPIWDMPAKIWGSRPAGMERDRECTDST